jgi:hypothetical protein
MIRKVEDKCLEHPESVSGGNEATNWPDMSILVIHPSPIYQSFLW